MKSTPSGARAFSRRPLGTVVRGGGVRAIRDSCLTDEVALGVGVPLRELCLHCYAIAIALFPHYLEARVGIEPTHKAFAEPCLTTWLPRRFPSRESKSLSRRCKFIHYFTKPSCRRLAHNSRGLKMPSGVIMPVINSAGVTSNPGLRAPLVGFATRT